MFETISSKVPHPASKASTPLSRPAFAAVALALATAVLLAALTAAEPARAATAFTINQDFLDSRDANFGDSRCDVDLFASGNQCTLRAAIEQANETPGTDAIHFDIPGGGVKTMRPSSELPTITEAVTIDGYTQPGAKKNTLTKGTNAVLLIELNGQSAGLAAGLRLGASNVVVRGLVINGFEFGGILASGANTRIEGNFIGTDPSGTLVRSNDGAGVTLDGLNAIVGGATPTSRNLISGNLNQGVRLFDSGARVQGNLIGTEKDGATALDGGFFTGNLGGLLVPGSNNVIGGSGPGEANTIAFNVGEAGVLVQSSGTGNRILGNSIFSNGRLGIDLDGGTQNFAGVTKNDTKDPDTGSNNLQNSPRLTSATTSDDRITMEGNLNSTPEKTFVLRFFSNPPGGEEGKTFVGRKSVTTNANGNAPFTFSFAKTVSAGRTVTATATGPGGNTSEFSAPRTVAAP
jgi:hypothetical protein